MTEDGYRHLIVTRTHPTDRSLRRRACICGGRTPWYHANGAPPILVHRVVMRRRQIAQERPL